MLRVDTNVELGVEEIIFIKCYCLVLYGKPMTNNYWLCCHFLIFTFIILLIVIVIKFISMGLLATRLMGRILPSVRKFIMDTDNVKFDKTKPNQSYAYF